MKVNKQTFTLVFDKEYYLAGFDPYDTDSVSQSFSAQIKTKPKKEYGIKKQMRKIKFWFYSLCYIQCLSQKESDEVVTRWFRIKMNKYKK